MQSNNKEVPIIETLRTTYSRANQIKSKPEKEQEISVELVESTLNDFSTKRLTSANPQQSDDGEVNPSTLETTPRQNFRELLKTYAPDVELGKYKTEDSQQRIREKKDLLFQLKREYPDETFEEDTSIEELRFECDKRRSFDEEKDHVEFMKSILLLVLNGIEFVNSKMKILELDGWSESVSKNMKSHEKVLKLLHVRYFKKTMSDPVAELGWTLVGSMVLFHFMNRNAPKNKKKTRSKKNKREYLGKEREEEESGEEELDDDEVEDEANNTESKSFLNENNIGSILKVASQFI